MLKRVTAFSITMLLSSMIHAETHEFEFDKAHADITFRVSHLGYSNTHGRFNEFDGTLTIDPDKIEESDVNVTIYTKSVETSFKKRNEHLMSEDFFHVDAHPEMMFASTSITKTGESTATLLGDLTILGVVKPIALDLTINKIAPHPRSGKLTAGFTAVGMINRSEWGMDKFVPGIGDEIELRLDMEASVKDE